MMALTPLAPSTANAALFSASADTGGATDSTSVSFDQVLTGQLAAKQGPASKARLTPSPAKDGRPETATESAPQSTPVAAPDMLALLLNMGALAKPAQAAAALSAQDLNSPPARQPVTLDPAPLDLATLSEKATAPGLSPQALKSLLANAGASSEAKGSSQWALGPQIAAPGSAPAPQVAFKAAVQAAGKLAPEMSDDAMRQTAELESMSAGFMSPTATTLPASSVSASFSPSPSPTATPMQWAHPFGQPGWNEAVGQRLIWMTQDQLQSATVTLNPPHLGPLQVAIQIENQQATVQFVTAQPLVQKALEDAMPTLRDMLAQNGIALGQANVGSSGHGQQHSAPGSSRRKLQGDEASDTSSQPSPGVSGVTTGAQGLVNLLA
jgi:flagellar hook-length control protein FliK